MVARPSLPAESPGLPTLPTLRSVWARRKPTLGGWCSIASGLVAELMGTAGFDWVCIDLQHGFMGYESLVGMLQALASTRTPSLVRVPCNDPSSIMKALDAGADGILVPMVNDPDEAEAAVLACHYPPEGLRSWGTNRMGLHPPPLTPQEINRSVVCLPMVETQEAFDHLDAILEIAGVDGIFIGPADLAVSLGMAPTTPLSEPELNRRLLQAVDSCRRHDRVAGLFCSDSQNAHEGRGMGFEMLALSSDVRLLAAGATALLQALRREIDAGEVSRISAT